MRSLNNELVILQTTADFTGDVGEFSCWIIKIDLELLTSRPIAVIVAQKSVKFLMKDSINSLSAECWKVIVYSEGEEKTTYGVITWDTTFRVNNGDSAN